MYLDHSSKYGFKQQGGWTAQVSRPLPEVVEIPQISQISRARVASFSIPGIIIARTSFNVVGWLDAYKRSLAPSACASRLRALFPATSTARANSIIHIEFRGWNSGSFAATESLQILEWKRISGSVYASIRNLASIGRDNDDWRFAPCQKTIFRMESGVCRGEQAPLRVFVRACVS